MDWAQAGTVASLGFLGVFIILALLSLACWVTSVIIFKVVSMKGSKAPQGNK